PIWAGLRHRPRAGYAPGREPQSGRGRDKAHGEDRPQRDLPVQRGRALVCGKAGELMCGRYYVEPESSSELLELIAEAKRKSDEVKTGEVFPSDTAAVIANNRQLKPTVFPMRWGFERRGGGLVINARSETAAEKQLFRESAQLRRCLIPASCYFE